MTKLKLSDSLSIPVEALAATQAILAIKGAGKSYGAMKMMEEAVKGGFQAVALDPTGIWWGVSAAGDGPALPVLVMGGEHGNVPLESTSGEVVAEFIVDSGRSVVLDLSLMRKAEMHRFMAAFLDKLYHYKATHRENLHVFFDEADTAAPQSPGPEQAKVLGAAEDVVRRGRSRGLGMTLITQRPAVLNKNLLEMCDTLFVMRVVGSNDQEAIRRRVRVDASDADVAAMMQSLASLKNGEAWVWSPSSLGIFKRFKFGARQTFDSGKSPRPGERMAQPKARAEIDLNDLTAKIKATVDKSRENDPASLKATIAGLRKELATAIADKPKAIEKIVEVPVLKNGQLDRTEKMAARLEVAGDKLAKEAAELRRLIAPATARAAHAATVPASPSPRVIQRPPTPARSVKSTNAGGDLPKGEKAILIAVAQNEGGAASDQLTVLTGYKRSTRDAYLQRLRERGFIENGGNGFIATDEGIASLGHDFEPLPTGAGLRTWWIARLPEGERRIFEALIESYPAPVDREFIGEATGFKRSTRDAYLQRLASRRLIVPMANGLVALSENLID